MQRYGEFVHRAAPAELPALTVEAVAWQSCHGMGSAPGLDGWHDHDLALLTEKALGILTALYNAVEKKLGWRDE